MSELPTAFCRGLRILVTDIDDTLTSEGLLPPSSYGALWQLVRAGVEVIPVTGRPAGWCDHIARMWPVAGVIGENGAFHYSYDRERRQMRRSYTLPPAELAAGRQRLARIAERVLREVPGTAVAADQAYRVSDFAIDYCEDVPRLPLEAVDEICRILSEEKVSFRVSSIHVNYWVGSFDKLSCLRRFLQEQGRGTLEALADQLMFIGDSPNDEPLFAGIPHTIAVANIRHFLSRLSSRPEFITTAGGAEGFAEAAGVVLRRRSAAAP